MSESHVPYRRTFLRLLTFLAPYKASLAVSTVLAVLSQAAAIGIVLLVGEAIDGIDQRRGTGALAWIVVGIVLVGIAKAAFMWGRRIISGRQALGIEKDMREGLYAHLLRLSFRFYDRHQTGQLMSRANSARRRSSCANAFTTWTPTIDSSVTVATSPSFCCTSRSTGCETML